MKDAEKKFLIKFGKTLADLRKGRNYTQSDLAERLSISRLSLAYLETGRRWPRPVTLQKLAKSLGVSVSDLFRGL